MSQCALEREPLAIDWHRRIVVEPGHRAKMEAMKRLSSRSKRQQSKLSHAISVESRTSIRLSRLQFAFRRRAERSMR